MAIQKIDEQTEALVSMIGDNQVDYRFFIGFKLIVTEEKVSLDSMKKSAFLTLKEFLNEVNHTLMNDFISMPDDEINRYMKMENCWKIKSPAVSSSDAWTRTTSAILSSISMAGTAWRMRTTSIRFQRRS